MHPLSSSVMAANNRNTREREDLDGASSEMVIGRRGYYGSGLFLRSLVVAGAEASASSQICPSFILLILSAEKNLGFLGPEY